MWSGVQPEQHLQPGVRQDPAARLQARRSHDAPGAVPLLPVWRDSVVPLPPCQLRYVSAVKTQIKTKTFMDPSLMEAVFSLADHSTPASQSPHSSNPSSLPSSPPTHNHGAMPFSNFGPIGTPDSRDRRVVDRWKADKTGEGGAGSRSRKRRWNITKSFYEGMSYRCFPGAVSGFGLDYLPAAASSAASDTSWHQSGPTGSSWTNQESPMEESSSTVLLDSLKVAG